MPLLVLREILNRNLRSHVKLWLNLNSTGYLVNDIAFYPAVCHVSKGQCLDSDLGGICSCCLMYNLNLNHRFVLLELQCHHPWLPPWRDKVGGMTMRSCLALPLCHTQRVTLACSPCDIPDPILPLLSVFQQESIAGKHQYLQIDSQSVPVFHCSCF